MARAPTEQDRKKTKIPRITVEVVSGTFRSVQQGCQRFAEDSEPSFLGRKTRPTLFRMPRAPRLGQRAENRSEAGIESLDD